VKERGGDESAYMQLVHGAGCTEGSTLVDHHQHREAAAARGSSDRGCRPARPPQSSWATPRSRSDIDESVFRIYKGIKCFDFCKTHNVIATGGKYTRLLLRWPRL